MSGDIRRLTALPAVRRLALPRLRFGFPLAFALGLCLISLVPYLLAYLWTPPGKQFIGFFFIADDATTYLAKMRQGAEGSWLWSDPYTSEPHHGVFLFGFYLFFGHLAAWLHLPLIATYHLARLSGGVALILAVDRLAARLIRSARRLGVVLVMLGSGLGFLAQLFNDPSVLGQRVEALDLHLPELSGWYSMLAIPHFAWAAALIVLAILGLLSLREGPSLWRVLGTGMLLTALAAMHPQMLPVLLLVWVAHHLVRLRWGVRPKARALLAEAAAFALPAPLLVYQAWLLYRDPTIAHWGAQWRHQAPGVLSLVLALGLPLLAALYGMWLCRQRRDGDLALLAVWPPLVFALLYLPNVANIQRRLLDGLYIPVGLLAALGIHQLASGYRRPQRLERLAAAVAGLSSALLLVIALFFARGGLPEMYIPMDESWALAWLSTHHRAGDRLLSSPNVGLLVPGWSGVPVYVGHYSETIDYFAKIATVDRLLQSSTPPDEIQSFLSANGITLLYWGADERAALTYRPDQAAYLRLLARFQSVSLYQVN